MPTYVYKCENCGEFESTHSISTKLEKCPECEKAGKTCKVERQIASTSFVLSGGCWAKDNYR